MSNPTQEVYKDKEACFSEIRSIREYFGKNTTTRTQFKSMFFALGSMILYGPKEIQSIVESTLQECTRREMHFEMYIWEPEQ